MKRKHAILILLLAISFTAISQSKKSVTAFAGYSDDGFATMVNLQYYPTQSFSKFYEIGIYGAWLEEVKSGYDIPLKVYTLNAGYHFRLDKISSITNSIATTLGLGGVIGKEELNNGSKDLPNGALLLSEDGLIYGAYGALETDIFLSNNLSLMGRYTHFYHVNSDVGKSKFMIAIGLKYIFI